MTTDQTAEIIKQSAQNIPVRTIGKNIGVHYSTVNEIQHQPDIKARIEAIHNRVINEAVEASADNIIHAVRSYKSKTIKKDPQLRDHGFKASNIVLQAIGILPSHAPSPMIINIMQAGNTYISPIVTELLGKMIPAQASVPDLGLGVIDVVPVTVDNPVDKSSY